MADTLPKDIVEVLEYLAGMARGYDNHLKWNEEAKLKADLMHNRRYWRGLSLAAIRAKCRQLGMRSEDVALILDLIDRAQQGRRLVAQRGYRDFRFPHDRPTPPDDDPQPFVTSLKW
ncbi:hypothetical protein N866_01765 [Actinotalea ferrariae CF5-4]|uniref:Uncharacterized protein n=1 Tax=Actinotalea ferrariae CF5-4 TaxID=948458 RepID=A0A021VQ40_9CELL|nr:hypothetical protein [Actinotalea ferrariae]EYR63266.1 hypothetical protein N866_01765 [Actinotalea ferrariae CF5-4]